MLSWSYIAGPYCDIACGIRRGGDPRGETQRQRRSFRSSVGAGRGALFLQINRNKSASLDPMKAEGQEVLRRLVAKSDVVVINLPPQTLQA